MFSCCKRPNHYLFDLYDAVEVDENGDFYANIFVKKISEIQFIDIIPEHVYENNIVAEAITLRFNALNEILTQFERNNPHDTETKSYLNYKKNLKTAAQNLCPFISSDNSDAAKLELALNAFQAAAKNILSHTEKLLQVLGLESFYAGV